MITCYYAVYNNLIYFFFSPELLKKFCSYPRRAYRRSVSWHTLYKINVQFILTKCSPVIIERTCVSKKSHFRCVFTHISVCAVPITDAWLENRRERRTKKQRAYSKFTLEARRRGHRKALFPSLQRPRYWLTSWFIRVRVIDPRLDDSSPQDVQLQISLNVFHVYVYVYDVKRKTEREREREREREAEVRSEIRESTERGEQILPRELQGNGMILLDVGQGKYAGQWIQREQHQANGAWSDFG